MGFLLIAYWIGVLVLLLVGLIKLIIAAVQGKALQAGTENITDGCCPAGNRGRSLCSTDRRPKYRIRLFCFRH